MGIIQPMMGVLYWLSCAKRESAQKCLAEVVFTVNSSGIYEIWCWHSDVLSSTFLLARVCFAAGHRSLINFHYHKPWTERDKRAEDGGKVLKNTICLSFIERCDEKDEHQFYLRRKWNRYMYCKLIEIKRDEYKSFSQNIIHN